MIKLSKRILKLHISKYIIVGLINTIVGYAAYFLFILLNIQYPIALLLAHIIGVINSYFWNKYFTFRSSGRNWKELVRFIIVYILYYLLNLILLFIIIKLFNADPLIGQAIALIFVTTLSFFAHKYWTFKI